MSAGFFIDYARGLSTIDAATYDDLVAALRDELPHVWHERYRLMCGGRPTNVLTMNVAGFDYLFDYTSELALDAEDRLVVAYGLSRAQPRKRPKSRIGGFPGSDARGDRGHFLAHSAGGGSDINLFHQLAALNRGWSPEGKRYRAMETYCARHPGTFFFSRPIYDDDTARPARLEFGVLTKERRFEVEVFENR